MNRSVQQLKYALQTLALPVTAQLHLHASDGCRVEELALSFDRWQRRAQSELNDELTCDQMEALNRLDQKLLKLSGSRFKPTWSELSLRSSREWREVRNMAREALATFNWPLDVPPPMHG